MTVAVQSVTAFTAASGNFTATGTSACFVGAGGGGGGGGVSAAATAGGGGGGGAVEQIAFLNNLTNGRQYDYVVGAGGTAGANTGADGGAGGATTVTDHISSAVIFSCSGASGGKGNTGSSTARGGADYTNADGSNIQPTTVPAAGIANQWGGANAQQAGGTTSGSGSTRFPGGTTSGAAGTGGGGGAGSRGAGSNAPAAATQGVSASANTSAGGSGASAGSSTANKGGVGGSGYLDVYQFS